jgi:uncharacterized damage-inducible protein DinB
MTRSELINNLLADNEFVTEKLKLIAQKLSSSELRQKPSENKWSAMEVAEHMWITNSLYLKNSRNAVANYNGKVSEDYKPGFIGNFLANSLLPNEDGKLSIKMKTFRAFDPARNSEPTGLNNSFGRLIDVLSDFNDFYLKAEIFDMSRMKVQSSLGKILMLRLGDALRFNSNHNIRHMNQLEQAITSCKGVPLNEIIH